MAEDLFSGKCIRTYSGNHINVFQPEEHVFLIEDIAHGLSNECRFGGHTAVFYSVAQHSVLCSKMGRGDNQKFDMLMHDATEAFLKDIPRPIKGKLINYKEIENKLTKELANEFGFSEYGMSGADKNIDNTMLKREYELLMVGYHNMNGFKKALFHLHRFVVNTVYAATSIDLSFGALVPFWPSNAKRLFLNRYMELTGKSV